MKQRNTRFAWRKFALISLAVVLLLGMIIGVTVGFAEYTKSTRAKRVIAAYEDSGMLFSSNYLLLGNDALDNRRTVFVSNATDTPSTHVTVCNYAQGNPTKTYERDIEYKLSAKLVVILNGVKRDATAADLNGETVSLSFHVGENTYTSTLSGSNLSHVFENAENGFLDKTRSDQNYCEVSFSSDMIDSSLFVEFTATPAAGNAGLASISGVFGASLAGSSQSLTWNGYFNEAGALDVSGAAAPSAFDGFNYVIEGSGKGSCTLSWNTAKLEINQIFLTEVSPTLAPTTSTVSGEVWKTVTFSVDSDTKNRYDLQFYYADGDVSFADWNAVKSCVIFEYTENP